MQYNKIKFYQEDLPIIVRSTILMDINKKLKPIINYIAIEFLRHLPLVQVRMTCGTVRSEGREESAELREVCLWKAGPHGVG